MQSDSTRKKTHLKYLVGLLKTSVKKILGTVCGKTESWGQSVSDLLDLQFWGASKGGGIISRNLIYECISQIKKHAQ